FADRLECVLHCERRVGENLFQNCFSTRDQLRSGHDFVNESDGVGFLSANDLSGENELKRVASADEPRQTLCSAAAWDHSKFHFRLPKFPLLRDRKST